ncbi:hypothetical protein [Streptomyces sp. NBC_00233]|uniref:hypothetical protein n=1 Tax=Streptomyces sp. NBC_00233 TaxID=2975686 RepID=UPI00224DD852|nr:hypothetical protein [Streptomyces sp. NBC_00233]
MEVRCILHADRRVVVVARQVREDVRTALNASLAGRCDATKPVTVLVSVTRID